MKPTTAVIATFIILAICIPVGICIDAVQYIYFNDRSAWNTFVTPFLPVSLSVVAYPVIFSGLMINSHKLSLLSIPTLIKLCVVTTMCVLGRAFACVRIILSVWIIKARNQLALFKL